MSVGVGVSIVSVTSVTFSIPDDTLPTEKTNDHHTEIKKTGTQKSNKEGEGEKQLPEVAKERKECACVRGSSP